MTVLGVFFPSLMGFGILVSGALLVADVVHKMLPHQGRRRRRRVAIGAYGLVAAAARSVGRNLPVPGFLTRSFRSRTEYFGVALVAMGAGWLVVVAGTEAYDDARGLFFSSPWIAGLTVGFAVASGITALAGLLLAIVHRRLPRRVHWIVEHSVLGRLRTPSAVDAVIDVTEQGGER